MVRADKRKFHYIYKITRNNSDRYYIGMHSTDNLDDGYFGSGTRLWKSIDKYGKENHTMEILEFCESREQLKIREKEIIGDLWKLDEDRMNLQPGGGGGCSEEIQFKRAKAGNDGLRQKLKDPEFKDEFGKAISKSKLEYYSNNPNTAFGCFKDTALQQEMVERARSPEARAKRKKTLEERNHQQGEKNSQFGKQWIYNESLKQCKRIGKEDPIPEGWKKGRKLKFE